MNKLGQDYDFLSRHGLYVRANFSLLSLHLVSLMLDSYLLDGQEQTPNNHQPSIMIAEHLHCSF